MTRLIDRVWVKELLTRESFTALDATALARAAGETRLVLPHELMNNMRHCSDLEVITIGYVPNSKSRKLYRLERRSEVD